MCVLGANGESGSGNRNGNGNGSESAAALIIEIFTNRKLKTLMAEEELHYPSARLIEVYSAAPANA